MPSNTLTPEERRKRGQSQSAGILGTPWSGDRDSSGPLSVPGQERDMGSEARWDRIRTFLSGQPTSENPFNIGLDLVNPSGGNAVAGAQGRATRATGAMLGEAFRLRDVEDERFGAASQRLTQAVDDLPETFSDADFEEFFRDEFTLAADAASQRMFGDMGASRAMLGGAGITGGGVAAGLAQSADIRRLRETKARGLQAKLDLRQAKMNADASDALRNINAEFNLANFNNQSPSLLGLDALTNASELALTELGLYLGDEAARRQAEAEEDAGFFGFLGSALGAGIPFLPFL